MYTAFGRSALHTRTHLDMVYSLGNSTGSPKVPCQRSMANHRNGHIWEGLERLVGWRWGGSFDGQACLGEAQLLSASATPGASRLGSGETCWRKSRKNDSIFILGLRPIPSAALGARRYIDTANHASRFFWEQSFPKLRIHNLQTVVRFGLGPAPGLGDAERGKWRKQTYFKTHQMQQFLRRVQL